MEITYILKIDCELHQIKDITKIVGVRPSKEDSGYWELIVSEKKSDDSIDFIGNFLNLLDNKYEQLSKIGIKRDDIDIWMLYEYEKQCNMEFAPQEMKRLGENGISLCISCWEYCNS